MICKLSPYTLDSVITDGGLTINGLYEATLRGKSFQSMVSKCDPVYWYVSPDSTLHVICNIRGHRDSAHFADDMWCESIKIDTETSEMELLLGLYAPTHESIMVNKNKIPLFEDFENEFFNNKLNDNNKRGTASVLLGSVEWFGTKGKLAIFDKNNVYARPDNVFDNKKLLAVEKMIKSADRAYPVEFEAGYGIVDVISLADIVETFSDDTYGYHYGRPLTTGDSDMDEYLSENFVDEYGDEPWFELMDTMVKFADEPARVRSDVLSKYEDDMDEDDMGIFDDAMEIYEDNYDILIDLEKKSRGDINKTMIQVRDGNHRTQGAFAAGVQRVAIDVSGNIPDGARLEYVG